MKTNGEQRRIKLFRWYAPSLELQYPEYKGQYACPLCGQLFNEGAVRGKSPLLTEEHCIPKAVGNSPRVLTCAGCNNDAGHEIDSQLHRRLEFEALWKGTRKDAAVGRLRIGGRELGMSLKLEGSPPKFHFHVSGRVTNPADINAILDAFKARAFPKQMSMNFGPKVVPNVTKSRIALLKASYLLMFGTYGYSYIDSPILNCVRVLATTFNKNVVPLADIVLRVEIERLPPAIAMVTAPKQLRSIAVPLSFPKYGVGYVGILPIDGSTYERWKTWRIDRSLDLTNLTYQVMPVDRSTLRTPNFTWQNS